MMRHVGFILMAMLMACVFAAGEVIVGGNAITGDPSCPLYKDGYCYVCPDQDCKANISEDYSCSCDCSGTTKDCIKKVAPAPMAEAIQRKQEESKQELDKSKDELNKAQEELAAAGLN